MYRGYGYALLQLLPLLHLSRPRYTFTHDSASAKKLDLHSHQKPFRIRQLFIMPQGMLEGVFRWAADISSLILEAQPRSD